ncbi:MAG: sensor histidine kinase [Bacillota bacterium]
MYRLIKTKLPPVKLPFGNVLNKFSFRVILVYFFAFTVISAIAISSIISYIQAIGVLQDNFVKSTAVIFKNVKNDLVSKLNNIENTLKFISSDGRVQSLNKPEKEISNRELAQFFSDCINLNNYSTGNNSRFIKNLIDELIFYSDKRVIITRRVHFSVYGIENYLTPDLLAKADQAEGQPVLTGVFKNPTGAWLMLNSDEIARRSELNQFAILKTVTDEQFKTKIGYLTVSINLTGLSDLLSDVQLGDTGRVYIVDRDLRVLAGGDKDFILKPIPFDGNSAAVLKKAGDGSLQGKFQGKKCFLHYEELGVNGWKLVGVISSREFQTKAQLIRDRIVIDGFLITALLIIATIMVANSLTRPLENIYAFLQKVEAGDLSIRTQETGSLEIQNLSLQLNRMIDRINLLLEEIYKEQLFQRKVALKALHAQINPHFLYNTLESISWMIEKGRREVAVKLVESLANFFRLGLSGGRDIVTIREELEHLESYLQIQQVRYQDRLDYIIDVDDEIKEERIVKITLQPLVENAIYHGIKPKKDGPGRVYISGSREDNFIKLMVVDNGVGMNPAKLAELEDSLEEAKLDPETFGKGYSIQNINSRIKLYCGEDYGLHFSSKEGIGTRVEVILPVDWSPNTVSEEGRLNG